MDSPARSRPATPEPPPSSYGSQADFSALPASPMTAAVQTEQARLLSVAQTASQENLFATEGQVVDAGSPVPAENKGKGSESSKCMPCVTIGGQSHNTTIMENGIEVDFNGLYGHVVHVERSDPKFSTVTLRVERVPDVQLGLRRVNGRADLRSETSSMSDHTGDGDEKDIQVQGHVDQAQIPVTRANAPVLEVPAANENSAGFTNPNPNLNDEHHAADEAVDENNSNHGNPGHIQEAQSGPAEYLRPHLARRPRLFAPNLPRGMDRTTGPGLQFSRGYRALRTALWVMHDLDEDDNGLFSDRAEAEEARRQLNVANIRLNQSMSSMWLAYEEMRIAFEEERSAHEQTRTNARVASQRRATDRCALAAGVVFFRWENELLQAGDRAGRL